MIWGANFFNGWFGGKKKLYLEGHPNTVILHDLLFRLGLKTLQVGPIFVSYITCFMAPYTKGPHGWNPRDLTGLSSWRLTGLACCTQGSQTTTNGLLDWATRWIMVDDDDDAACMRMMYVMVYDDDICDDIWWFMMSSSSVSHSLMKHIISSNLSLFSFKPDIYISWTKYNPSAFRPLRNCPGLSCFSFLTSQGISCQVSLCSQTPGRFLFGKKPRHDMTWTKKNAWPGVSAMGFCNHTNWWPNGGFLHHTKSWDFHRSWWQTYLWLYPTLGAKKATSWRPAIQPNGWHLMIRSSRKWRTCK